MSRIERRLSAPEAPTAWPTRRASHDCQGCWATLRSVGHLATAREIRATRRPRRHPRCWPTCSSLAFQVISLCAATTTTLEMIGELELYVYVTVLSSLVEAVLLLAAASCTTAVARLQSPFRRRSSRRTRRTRTRAGRVLRRSCRTGGSAAVCLTPVRQADRFTNPLLLNAAYSLRDCVLGPQMFPSR
jgi:hypothetical protein